jgi:hypothetical protein
MVKVNSNLVTGPIRHLAFEAATETLLAMERFPKFNSAHEGYAVLAEEVDELWEHVKVKQKFRDVEGMRKECIQIAAMALRFAHECCDLDGGSK